MCVCVCVFSRSRTGQSAQTLTKKYNDIMDDMVDENMAVHKEEESNDDDSDNGKRKF